MKLLFVCFLLIQTYLGAPCSILPNRWYKLNDMMKCLRKVPFNASSSEIRNLIPTLKKYYENNPYVDWFRSPPPGYEKYAFDFTAEIDAIGAKKFSDGFEYYVALSQLFLKFKDGHAMFLPPCLWNYHYALPFDIVVLNGDTDDDFLTPYFYISEYVSELVDVNLTYSQIIGIDFNGGKNFTEISKAVNEFALKYGSVQYNNHALWNQQIVHGFFGLNVAFYPPPANVNVTLQVILENKTTITTLTVPWYGIYVGESHPSSLNNLCPLRAAASASGFANNEAEEKETKKEEEGVVEEKEVEKKKNAKKILKEKKKRIIFGGDKKKARKDAKPRNSREAMEFIRKSMPRTSGFDISRLRRAHHAKVLAQGQAQAQAQTTPTPTMSESVLMIAAGAPVAAATAAGPTPTPSVSAQDVPSPISVLASAPTPTPTPTSTTTPTPTPVGFSLRKNADVQPAANILQRRKAQGWGTGTSTSAKGKKNAGSFTRLRDDDNLYPLWEDEDNELFFYIVPERRLGIVRLLSFNPEDDETFFADFVELFDQMANMKEVDNVVIDVRGNDGGSLELLEGIMTYLFPTLRPTAVETNFPKTAFFNDLKILYEPDAEEPDDSIWYAWNTTSPIADFYKDTHTQTFSYLNGTTYTKNFTKPYLWDIQYSAYGELKSYSPFDPQHVYVVSDGQCFSACGVFTKLVQDTHAAKVLGYSFNPFYMNREGLEMYNPGSCPGLELDSETIDDLRDRKLAPYFNSFRNFPPRLPRDDEVVGWTESLSYSINPLTRDQTLYFKNNTVDDIIPFFSTAYDGDEENLLDIAWYIDEAYVQTQYCFDWEVKVDTASCPAPSGSHQVWGHPCNSNHSFELNACAFAACEKGYFVSAAGECSVLPYWQDGTGRRRRKKETGNSRGG